MNILIVESPAKAKKIQSILYKLGYKDFKVSASCGHVRDLDKKTLSVDIDAGFVPKFSVMPGKIEEIRRLCRNVPEDKIWLGSDNDMEGEAIAWHLSQLLKLGNGLKRRVTFNEITEKALDRAMKNPRKINMDLVEAQLSRRILDRIVGFKLSPVLWKRIRIEGGFQSLSAGRVQSAALKIVCDREKEILIHTPSSHWTVIAEFKVLGVDVEAKLTTTHMDAAVVRMDSQEDVISMMKALALKPNIVQSQTRTSKESPPAPFITSSLQQAASQRGIGVQTTMRLAQALYEHGFITYMRTDSCKLADDALRDIEAHVRASYGKENHKWRNWEHKKKTKGAQEAHEAIRPTDVRVTRPEFNGITPLHKKLYDMIHKRTVASQMVEAEYKEATLKIDDKGLPLDTVFVGKTRALERPGWRLVYSNEEGEDGSDKTSTTRGLEVIQKLESAGANTKVQYGDVVTGHNSWTHPPMRYNEANLIKALETEGIGRPSTYASIIDKLYTKKYVEVESHKGVEMQSIDIVFKVPRKLIEKEAKIVTVGSDARKLTPTSIGKAVNQFLETNFDYIVDKTFTSNMEERLDKVAEGDQTRLELLSTFWKTFSKQIEKQDNTATGKIMIEKDKGKEIIDFRGDTWIIRNARYGPVLQKDKQFISLKAYLKEKKMSMSDIEVADVNVLVSYPFTRKNGEVIVALGPYGAYLKHDEKNFKVPPIIYRKYGGIAGMSNITDGDVDEILSYSAKKRPTNGNNITKKKRKFIKK